LLVHLPQFTLPDLAVPDPISYQDISRQYWNNVGGRGDMPESFWKAVRTAARSEHSENMLKQKGFTTEGTEIIEDMQHLPLSGCGRIQRHLHHAHKYSAKESFLILLVFHVLPIELDA